MKKVDMVQQNSTSKARKLDNRPSVADFISVAAFIEDSISISNINFISFVICTITVGHKDLW